MWLIVVLVMVAVAYWFFKGNTERGRKSVASAIFLQELQRGASAEEASELARSFTLDSETAVLQRAISFMQINYNGRQLATIADARRKGFVDRNG